jgi:CHASE2 domain-containing sensor protein
MIAVAWRSPLLTFMTLGLVAIGLVALGYGLIILGWWLPVAPIVMAWLGAGFISRYVQELQSLIAKSQQLLEQRERTIDEAFSAMHNGPFANPGNDFE